MAGDEADPRRHERGAQGGGEKLTDYGYRGLKIEDRRWPFSIFQFSIIGVLKRLSRCFERIVPPLCFVLSWAVNAAIAAQAIPVWQQEWEKTLDAAKKEGQVTVYISGYEAVLPDFEKEFPDIKVVAVTVRGNQLGQRLLAERRAEKYIADVVSSGANPNYQQFYPAKALDPIKSALILPEITDQTKWYLKKHQYSDPEGQYVFNYVGSATYGAVNYNTKLVDAKEFRSYWDLLNPKWKGKIEARDIREAGPGAGNTRFFYYHPELGPSFIKQLFGEMDITLFRDFRQGPDWLATGKFAICFFCDVDVLKQQGLPVETFGPTIFKEGGGLGSTVWYLGIGEPSAPSQCGEGFH